MILLSEYHLYISRNGRRYTDACCKIPRKRSHHSTNLSTEQANDLIHDLITELSWIKNMPLLSEKATILTEEDCIGWTRWTLPQLNTMILLVSPYMRSSKHHTPFETVRLFWTKLKTNLSFRQIGTLFKISTSQANI